MYVFIFCRPFRYLWTSTLISFVLWAEPLAGAVSFRVAAEGVFTPEDFPPAAVPEDFFAELAAADFCVFGCSAFPAGFFFAADWFSTTDFFPDALAVESFFTAERLFSFDATGRFFAELTVADFCSPGRPCVPADFILEADRLAVTDFFADPPATENFFSAGELFPATMPEDVLTVFPASSCCLRSTSRFLKDVLYPEINC